MENKKEIKKESSSSTPEVPDETIPQQKSKKTWIYIAIIVIFLILVLMILRIFFPFTFILGLFDNNLPSFPGNEDRLTGKDLDTITDNNGTVNQNVEASKGGVIQGKTGGGNNITLRIPPGSLKEDTNITITPVKESPIKDYPSVSDPGVVIGPPNISFDPPAWANIGGGTPAGSQAPGGAPGSGQSGSQDGQAPDESQDDTDPQNDSPLPDIPTNLPNLVPDGTGSIQVYPYVPTPPTGEGNDTQEDGSQPSIQTSSNIPDVVLLTSYDGVVVVAVSTTPSSGSTNGNEGDTDSGGGVGAPITDTGSVSTDETDKEEATKITDNAAANAGGSCTMEFLIAASNMMKSAGSEAEMSSYRRLIEDCLNLEYLRQLCANDRIKLRRIYFTQRLALAQRLDPSIAAELQDLMENCTAQYRIRASGSPAGGGGMISSSLDSSVCGYIDDEWSGDFKYSLIVDGASHVYSGEVGFKIPPTGGEFSSTTQGSHTLQIEGRTIPIPNFSLGFDGSFDGNTNVNLNLYPAIYIYNHPITLETQECVDPTTLPPLEPLTPPSSDDIPLVPLVPPTEEQ